jgi:putative transport protein
VNVGAAHGKQTAILPSRRMANEAETTADFKERKRGKTMFAWFAATLRQYPEIAIFLVLALGYYFGKFTFKGIGLGSVTATLLAGVLIGQIGITVSQPLKAFVFLMFLFAVGYGVGPQFVRGVAKDGLPQAIFAAIQCVFCLLVPVAIVKFVGYDLGYGAGLYSGSQTISAAMGLSTDAINRLGLPPEQAKAMLDSMPIAYAVTYMFGTVGSALVIALLGPVLLRINLPAACKDYEEKQGGTKEFGGAGTAWHRWVVRAFRVRPGGIVSGLRAIEAEALIPDSRVFVLRVRHADGTIEEATADTVLREGEVVAVAGARDVLVNVFGTAAKAEGVLAGAKVITAAMSGSGDVSEVYPPKEVDDPELLSMPVESIDVYVTNKAVDGKTLTELAQSPGARGVFLKKITRGAVATSIPILPNTKIYRGDILSIVGRSSDTAATIKLLGVADRPTDVADVCFIGTSIAIGALVGSLVLKIGGVPITLSTAGGALIAGLVAGWLRSVRPTFGRIPSSTVWFMNSVGLNIFIAIVGISAGPGFVNGLKTQGIGLFLWGAVATTVPLILGMFMAKYIFRFHDALTLGIVSGSRTTTASLGLVCDMGKSQVPALGYTVTYAVGNTFLTIWGMVLILLLK